MPTSTYKNNSHKSKKRNNSISKTHKNSKRHYSNKKYKMRGGSGNVIIEENNVIIEEKDRHKLLMSTREKFKNLEMQRYDKNTTYKNKQQLLRSTKKIIKQIEEQSHANYEKNSKLEYKKDNKTNTIIAQTKLDPITAQTELDEDLLTCYLIKYYINDIENYRSIQTADELFKVREQREYLLKDIKKLKDEKDEAQIRQSNLTIDKYDKIIKDLEVLEHPYADGLEHLQRKGNNEIIKDMKTYLKNLKDGTLSDNSTDDAHSFVMVSRHEGLTAESNEANRKKKIKKLEEESRNAKKQAAINAAIRQKEINSRTAQIQEEKRKKEIQSLEELKRLYKNGKNAMYNMVTMDEAHAEERLEQKRQEDINIRKAEREKDIENREEDRHKAEIHKSNTKYNVVNMEEAEILEAEILEVKRHEAERIELERQEAERHEAQIQEAKRQEEIKRLRRCNDGHGRGCQMMGGGGLEKKTKNERYKNSEQQKNYSNASY